MKNINPYIKDTYKDYDERVLMFLSRVYDDCVKNNDKLSNYFYCCLDLLAEQLKLYYLGVDAVNVSKSLSSTDDYKRVSKNPCIAILNHAHQEILNILQKLSLSPFDQAKLKRINNGNDDGSAEELLSELIK
jgi:phage terminase small subunit